MGGQGSGGARPGSGRKRKTPFEKVLSGTASDGERELVIHPPPIIPVSRPLDLAGQEQAVWDELEPLALAERTLTPSTTTAFKHLCEAIVLRREMAKTIALEGLTFETMFGPKKHPLLTEFRGMTQRVEAGLLKFRLSPIGKPLIEPPTKNDRDPFGELEGGATLDVDDDDDDRVD